LSPKYIPKWGKVGKLLESSCRTSLTEANEYEKAEIIFQYNPQKAEKLSSQYV